MNRYRPVTRLVVRGAATLLAAGGLGASVIGATSAAAASGSRVKSVVISTTTNTPYGTILVSGNSLYTLKTSKSPCGTNCRKVWPQVLLPKGVKEARASSGVIRAKLGTVKRKDGALQVTYNGKALYRFSLDRGPDQVNGSIKDRWGTWSVVVISKPAVLHPIADTTTTSPTSTTLGTAVMSHPTLPPAGTAPTVGTTPITTPPPPPPPTTTLPPTTTTTPPTTTTTSPGGGGVGF